MDWCMILLTLVIGGGISIPLLMGKGSFLIAGYNTAPEEEKRKYNKKKLCRATGTYMGILTLLILVVEITGENTPKWYVGFMPFAVVAGTVGFLIYANLGCLAKPGEEEPSSPKSPEEEAKAEKRHRLIVRGTIVFTAAVTAGVVVFLLTGEVKVRIQENELQIQASYWEDYELPLSEIQGITYRDDFHPGRKEEGVDSIQLNEGTFHNRELGTYILYSYARCDSFVVLETTGKTVVINGKNPAETKELYERILEETGLGE